MRKIIFIVVALLCWQTVQAADLPKPPYLQPEVLRAAIAMNMTEVQKPQFQAAITRFFDDMIAAMAKLKKKTNDTNLHRMQRKAKSKTKSLLKAMDKDVAGFLAEEQLPAYDTYRDALKSNLPGM